MTAKIVEQGSPKKSIRKITSEVGVSNAMVPRDQEGLRENRRILSH
jgi:hypothetical protein